MKKYTILIIMLLGLSCKKVTTKKKNDTVKVTHKEIVKEKSLLTIEDFIKEFKFVKETNLETTIATSAKLDFDTWVKELSNLKKLDNVAEKNIAGKLGKRFLNKRGVEIEQLIKKGLIGAYQLNGFNVSLNKAENESDIKIRKDALNKAIFYILGKSNIEKPKSISEFSEDGNAFGKYMLKVAKSEKYKNIDDNIYKAIKKAKESFNDNAEFKTTLNELRSLVSSVVAFRGVYYIHEYLNKARTDWTAKNVHELSEGLGFMYSLQFGYNSKTKNNYLTSEQAMAFANVDLYVETLDTTGNSFLDKQAKLVAELFGFTIQDL